MEDTLTEQISNTEYKIYNNTYTFIINFIINESTVKILVKEKGQNNKEFEDIFSINKLKSISKVFNICDNIKDFINLITTLLNENKIKIDREIDEVILIFQTYTGGIPSPKIILNKKDDKIKSTDEYKENYIQLKLEVENNNKETLKLIKDLQNEIFNLKRENNYIKKSLNIDTQDIFYNTNTPTNNKKSVKTFLTKKNTFINDLNNKIENIQQQLNQNIEYNNKTISTIIKNIETFMNDTNNVINSFKDDVYKQQIQVNSKLKLLLLSPKENVYFYLLNNWISPNKNISKNLIYKATRDGDKATIFHSLCDKKGPTITIILTERGETIGGFSNSSWDGTVNGFIKDDNSFIFNLNKKVKYNTINPNNSLFANYFCGPSFGNSDLHIVDSFFSNYSRAYHLNYFAENGDIVLKSNNAYKFKIIELEVYQIKFI